VRPSWIPSPSSITFVSPSFFPHSPYVASVPVAPSMSNFASLRVLPPFSIASSISASRCAKIALLTAISISPRVANVIARRAGPPTSRAWASAALQSSPPVPVLAITAPVVGLWRSTSLPIPTCQRPTT
jgi:hypothetical protein